MAKPENYILLARIGAPRGVLGQVYVKSFTDCPSAFGNYGPLFSKDGRKFSVIKVQSTKKKLVATFREIKDRNEAEGIRGTELFVRRKCFPEILDDNEFYVDDLLGMEAVNEVDDVIGQIRAVPNFGAGTLLEISPKLENGRFGSNGWFIVFNRINVPCVDLENRRVTIIRPYMMNDRHED